MPWTFAHPAAVLVFRPLTRSHLSLAALVVGALTPDLGYYVGCFGFATMAHTLVGLPLGCLPMGFALLWLLCVLRQPVCNLLPQPHRHALQGLPPVPLWDSVGQAWKVVLSLLLGAATHIVWDSFTHATGWGVASLPVLQQRIMFPLGMSLPIFSALQHGSTVVGVIALYVAYSRWLKRAPKAPAQASERWRCVLLVALVMMSLLCAAPIAYQISLSISSAEAGFVHIFVVRLIMVVTTVFAILLTGAALLVRKSALLQSRKFYGD